MQAPFVEAVRLAGQFGLTVDLCVRSHQIPEVTKLAELCPEVTFVLDHLGKPDIAAGQWTGWLQDIKAMARLDNVRCKLSGLTTEADEGTRGTNNIRRYLRAAVDAFRPERCMFGSDWPNASLQISYAGWVSLVLDSVSDLAAARKGSSHAGHSAGGLRTGLGVQMTINPTGSRRPLMRRASGDALGCAISSGPAAALTRGPHR